MRSSNSPKATSYNPSRAFPMKLSFYVLLQRQMFATAQFTAGGKLDLEHVNTTFPLLTKFSDLNNFCTLRIQDNKIPKEYLKKRSRDPSFVFIFCLILRLY